MTTMTQAVTLAYRFSLYPVQFTFFSGYQSDTVAFISPLCSTYKAMCVFSKRKCTHTQHGPKSLLLTAIDIIYPTKCLKRNHKLCERGISKIYINFFQRQYKKRFKCCYYVHYKPIFCFRPYKTLKLIAYPLPTSH